MTMFLEAAKKLGTAPPVVLSYEDWLAGSVQLADVLDERTLLRIESCGENARVDAEFCRRGKLAANSPGPLLSEEEFLGGRIGPSRLWYLGYCEFLRECEQALQQTGARVMNHPTDIRLLFDKAECQQYLQSRGISVPQPLGTFSDYAGFREVMDSSPHGQVFIKLRHSSSASGVLAYREFTAANNPGQRIVNATTTVELTREEGEIKLYNNLKPRRYTSEESVAEILDALGPQGWYAEEAIPKATVEGRNFDLRVLMIAGEVRHTVVRTSRSPLTNLHLGNARGNLETVRQLCPDDQWEAACNTLRQAAQAFPNSLYLGVDLAFERSFQSHYILEINAFGDLLPNLFDEGDDTYTAELRAAHR